MSKALPGNNETFDDVMTVTFYDVILYFRLCLGKKRKKIGISLFFIRLG